MVKLAQFSTGALAHYCIGGNTKALRLSLDELVFDESESQPSAQMKRLVDSVERLSEDEQSIIRELIDGMIIKYEVKRLSEATSAISK